MKTPRIADFDPNAKTSALKSSMDNFPVIQKSPQQVQSAKPLELHGSQSTQPPLSQTSAPLSLPKVENITQTTAQYGRTGVRRFLTRSPFEFFQDQIEWLRKKSLAEKTQGGLGSMSKMVREALDDYIKKHSK